MDTNSDVLNYGRRVNDYIRSLHTIIVNARRQLDGPDDFPWNEWAAFFAQWDQYFFEEIEHGIILWFAEDTLREYQSEAKDWERVIARHYHKSPEGPRPSEHGESSSIGFGGLLAAAGVVTFLAWRSKN